MSFSATKLHQIIQILLASMGIPRPQYWLLTHARTLYFLQWWTSYRTVQRAESPVGARYTMFHIRYRAIPDAELSSASPAGGSFISEFNMSWVSLTGETVHGLEARDKGRDLLLWQSSHYKTHDQRLGDRLEYCYVSFFGPCFFYPWWWCSILAQTDMSWVFTGLTFLTWFCHAHVFLTSWCRHMCWYLTAWIS